MLLFFLGWISAGPKKSVKLTCPPGKTIFIRKVRHSAHSKCCPHATKAVLTAMCNGKKECKFSNSQETLGGHCNDNIGKLALRYKCMYGLGNAIQACNINNSH